MGKIIRDRWYSAAVVLLCAANIRAAGDLAPLLRAHRQDPTGATRAAVQSYSVTHPKDAALANLGLGVAAFEQKDYAAAIAYLKRANVPQIADYVAYYLAAARVEIKDTEGVAQDLAATHTIEIPSPLAGRAWIVEARALGADGVRVLREHYPELPQPDGDLALGEAYQAAGDLAHAADFYQRVFYQYVSGEPATRSAAALLALKDLMGPSYPAPLPQQALQRADKLLEAREYAEAQSEYLLLTDQLVGTDRDVARVRVGAAELAAGKPGIAGPYLRGLDIAKSEADAERLYWIVETSRRMNDEAGIKWAVEQLGKHHEKSKWRLKALAGAANWYLVANRPEAYVPLYRAAYEDFPTEPNAGLYHWKVTFQSYLHDRRDAARLLREHLRNYPQHATAGAALYFLGRHAEREHDNAAARAYYERLARALPNQFYAMEARERLRQPEIAAAGASDEAARFAAELKLAEAKPAASEPTRETTLRIERSRLLRTAGLGDFADAELRFGARTDGQSQLLGMEMASAAESPYIALRAMKSLGGDYLTLPMEQAPRRFWEMLFPLPYRSDLERNARLQGLDPFLLAGLIRQESEFNPQALSGANAYGLMQVRPGTGREVARRAGIPRLTARMLTQPAVNLKIGSYVLRGMLDQHGGKIEETLAAYNAGPLRAAEWRTWANFREPAEFIETIPFTETRDYVQAVLRNAEIYRRLYK